MKKKHRYFSLTELLVCISILAVLISLLAPSIRNTIGNSNKISCLNNLKSQYTFSALYMGDSDDLFPYAGFSASSNNDEAIKTYDFEGYSWDDYLSDYDGRNLPHDLKKNTFLNKSSLSENNITLGSEKIYACPEDDIDRRQENTRLRRTYTLNAHVLDGSRNSFNVKTAKGISAGRYAVSTSEIEDTSGTIYLAEHPHSNNDLGGNLKNYNNNPASILEYDAKNTNLTTLGRLGLHDGYTSFNFLFTDGHSVNHLLSETATGAVDKNANGMWSRQAGD